MRSSLRLGLALTTLCWLAGCGGAAHTNNNASSKTASGVRQAVVSFVTDVEHGRYTAACAFYTPRVLASVGGHDRCARSLVALRKTAATQRARGKLDVLTKTMQKAKVMAVSIKGDVATTKGLGSAGTTTTFHYARARWEINRPAT
jgi:hypothetical protein